MGSSCLHEFDMLACLLMASPFCCRLPRTVGAHVSLLVPHLGCKAYPIRSGIVNAIGHLIARGFEAPEEDSNAPGKAPRCSIMCCHPRGWNKPSDCRLAAAAAAAQTTASEP
jgi:hypothetical protein